MYMHVFWWWSTCICFGGEVHACVVVAKYLQYVPCAPCRKGLKCSWESWRSRREASSNRLIIQFICALISAHSFIVLQLRAIQS